MAIYFNLVTDEEGLFGSEKVLVFSSGKDYISNGYSQVAIDSFPLELTHEMNTIYSYDEDSITESQLLFELKNRGFVLSEALQIFEDEEAEEIAVPVETVPVAKTYTCPVCGKVYTQKALRDLENVGGAYLCDCCEEELDEEEIWDAVELAPNEFICKECGLIEDKKEIEVDSNLDYICPRCEEVIINEKDSDYVASEWAPYVPGATAVVIPTTSTSEEDEDEEEEEEEEMTCTTPATTTPIVPVAKLKIKDWNDLVGNVKLAYDFLANYVKLGKKGINEPIITRANAIKGSVLLDVLENAKIIDKDYRVNYVSKYYKEDMVMNLGKSGSMDDIQAFVLLAMGCRDSVAKNLATVYSMNTDALNDIYLYWNALIMASDVKYAKVMFKNAMNTFDKEFKSTAALFEVEDIDIPQDVLDFVVDYKDEEESTTTATTTTSVSSSANALEDASAEFVWDVVKIANGPIETKYIRISSEAGLDVPEYMVKALAIRGVDVSTAPYFKIPAYVTVEDVPMLVSGIVNLKQQA